VKRLVATLALSAVALIAAACSSGAAPTPVAPPSGEPSDTVTITANSMRFDTATLDFKAATAIALTFQNPDSVPHNVAIYGADGSKVFGGDMIDAGKSIVYQVPALTAGTYSFKCDLHPDMKGSVFAR
jgi:plastocyanin